MRKSFWVDDNFRNVKRVKELIKNNPKITRREISIIMKKSKVSIERMLNHYNIYLTEAPNTKLSANTTRKVEPTPVGIEKYKSINWKIKKSKKLKNLKRAFKKILLIVDVHIRHQNNAAVKCVLSLMDDVIFDGIYNLGDYLDCGCLSHWNKYKRRSMEGLRLVDDFKAGNSLLDEFDRRLPEGADKRFWYGNHEDWVNQYLELHTELEGLLSPTKKLKLKERGYTVYEGLNHVEKIGRLHFTHGHYTGVYHLKNMIMKNMCNIIAGHSHTMGMRLIPTSAREIAMVGYSVPCLCNLNPSYLLGKPSAHSQGFAIVNFYGDKGFFSVELYRIIRGILIYGDKIYNGNDK